MDRPDRPRSKLRWEFHARRSQNFLSIKNTYIWWLSYILYDVIFFIFSNFSNPEVCSIYTFSPQIWCISCPSPFCANVLYVSPSKYVWSLSLSPSIVHILPARIKKKLPTAVCLLPFDPMTSFSQSVRPDFRHCVRAYFQAGLSLGGGC